MGWEKELEVSQYSKTIVYVHTDDRFKCKLIPSYGCGRLYDSSGEQE